METGEVARYRYVSVWFGLAVSAFFVILAAVLAFVGTRTVVAFPGLGPSLFLLAVWALSGYWWGRRVAWELRLSGDRFLWRAPLRSVEIPLTALRGLRRTRFPSAIEVIETTGNGRLLVYRKASFTQFAAALSRVAPTTPISPAIPTPPLAGAGRERAPTLWERLRAVIPSFIIPGVGTIINGEVRKGVAILLGWAVTLAVSNVLFRVLPVVAVIVLIPVTLTLTFSLWIYGMVDAFRGA
jgi:hypothetical protein